MQPDAKQRIEHGWCLELKGSKAFAFYLAEMQRPLGLAHREVCAENTENREYQAGRLSAFVEASHLIENRYRELAKVVEVVES